MSQENVEIVRAMNESWNRGEAESALARIDPEIEVHVADGGLFDGSYHGHAGLRKLLTGFWGLFKEFRTEVEEYLPAGDKVVVSVHHHGRGIQSGVEVDMRHWQVWTLREGKACRWQIFSSKQAAFEVAGLSEQDGHAEPS
jgi:ketosteroid isomerase-like protein